MTVSISGTSGITFPDGSLQTAAASPLVLRNRIINGDMRIDQRNAGASVTPTVDGTYQLDRWQSRLSVTSKFSIQQNAGSVTPPAGFTKYLGITSLSAYSVGASEFFALQQAIEGFNTADFAWGTANASAFTISFWVRSSLTGTFGGAVYNSAGNRCYPFSYSISSANTWEQKSVTIAGDTTGTWVTDNGIGLNILFGLGAGATVSGTAGAWGSTLYRSATGATSVVGTNGATFYITGVQLEQNTSATPFERRLYGQELANCQRYYYKFNSSTSNTRAIIAYNVNTTSAYGTLKFPVSMRTNPTALEQSGTAANYGVAYLATSSNCSSVPTFVDASQDTSTVSFTLSSGLTAGQGSALYFNTTAAYLGWSAEL
jgi:hypothetical protein